MDLSALVITGQVLLAQRLVEEREQAQDTARSEESEAGHGKGHDELERLLELTTKGRPLTGPVIKCQSVQLGFLAQDSERRPWRTGQFLQFAFCLQDSRLSSRSHYSSESFVLPLAQSMEKSDWHQN